jgi:hypothetical protein
MTNGMSSSFVIRHSSSDLRFGFGFAEVGDFVAGFALAALFQERGALETLQNIALATQSGSRAETAML